MSVMLRELERLSRADVGFAGGKGANLGELAAAGFPVPPGFVVGATAYASFCDENDLRGRIERELAEVDVDDTAALERSAADIRALVEREPVPESLADEIAAAYEQLAGDSHPAVAVRSSATAEDAESASFAGMGETFLNVRGSDAALDAVRRCWSSLFGARTIYYRAKSGFGQADMDMAVVVQRLVHARCAGVLFTIDPATGESGRMIVEAAFGLGESVVSGLVSPDRYAVGKAALEIEDREIHHKGLTVEEADGGGTSSRELSAVEAERPALDDGELARIARLGVRVEERYGSPQDIEWAIDEDGVLWTLQSRPVTVRDSVEGTAPGDGGGNELLHGLGAAPGLAAGPVRVIANLEDAWQLDEDEILVAHLTAPLWVPLMQRAAAIVTDAGGMTCHAAIVSRELGIPCLVGTAAATSVLQDGEVVTVDAKAGIVSAGYGERTRASRPRPQPSKVT